MPASRELTDFIKVYDKLLPDELCDAIVSQFEADAEYHLQRDLTNVRAFTELNIDQLPHWSETHRKLIDLTRAAVERYRTECTGFFPDPYDYEAIRIKRYLPGKNQQFADHVDGYDMTTARRYLVCFWYLNDVDEGGETSFPTLDIKVKPNKGRLLMFPPFWMYIHAGLPPLSGAKYIVGTYPTFM